ncbi:MAG: TRAP transporter small permease subunit [Pseudomonadota bacterium]
MLTRLNDLVERAALWLLALLFAGLIAVVGLQVLARNVLQVPMIWTLDMAQLLFSWCIFVGAAVAFRQKRHYEVNIWPETGAITLIPRIAATVACVIVIYVLARHGFEMAQITLPRFNQSLQISEVWFIAPIPLGGALMALFLVEQIAEGLTGSAKNADDPPTDTAP